MLEEQLKDAKKSIVETEERWKEIVAQKENEIQKLQEVLKTSQAELDGLRLYHKQSVSTNLAQTKDYERDLQKELKLQELTIMQQESKKLAELNQALQKAEQATELVKMDYQKRMIDEELKWNREY